MAQLLLTLLHDDGRQQTLYRLDHPANPRDCTDPSCPCSLAAPLEDELDLGALFAGADGGALTMQTLLARAGRGWTPHRLGAALRRRGCWQHRTNSERGWRLPPGTPAAPGEPPVQIRNLPLTPGEARARSLAIEIHRRHREGKPAPVVVPDP